MGGLRSQVGLSYAEKVIGLLGSSNVIGYWKMDEATGTTAADSSAEGNNGTYSGCTLANAAMPAAIGGSAPLFDGVNDVLDVYSAGLEADFSGAEGGFACWAKVFHAGVWTDGVSRFVMRVSNSDNSDFFAIQRTSTNNQLVFRRQAGGVNSQITASLSSTDWLHLAITWSVSADTFKVFINGTQEGSTLTGLAAYSPNDFNTDRCCIGSFQTASPNGVWNGWVGHAWLTKTCPSDAEIAILYSWGA